jgi:hypothetical protein
MTKAIPIAWRDSPFAGQVHRAVRPEGVSILEIVESIPNLPMQFAEKGEVCVNGQQVPRHLWRFVRPRTDRREVVVTLHLAPGNHKTLALVASVAVLVAAVAISDGALAPLASFFAPGAGWFAAGSVSVGGTIKIG